MVSQLWSRAPTRWNPSFKRETLRTTELAQPNDSFFHLPYSLSLHLGSEQTLSICVHSLHESSRAREHRAEPKRQSSCPRLKSRFTFARVCSTYPRTVNKLGVGLGGPYNPLTLTPSLKISFALLFGLDFFYAKRVVLNLLHFDIYKMIIFAVQVSSSYKNQQSSYLSFKKIYFFVRKLKTNFIFSSIHNIYLDPLL